MRQVYEFVAQTVAAAHADLVCTDDDDVSTAADASIAATICNLRKTTGGALIGPRQAPQRRGTLPAVRSKALAGALFYARFALLV